MSFVSRWLAQLCPGAGMRRLVRPPAPLQVECLEQRELMDAGAAATLRFDFGKPGAPVAPGYAGVPLMTYDSALGHGWESIRGGHWLMAVERKAGDPLPRDFHFGPDATFLVDLPNGTYDVTVTLGDGGRNRDEMALWAEDKQLAVGLSTPAGQFISPTFRVEVRDGQLDLRVADLGGENGNFAINGLEVGPVVTSIPKVPDIPDAPGTPGAPELDSPTGRNPTLVWSARQQAVWARMRAENHPWWQMVQENADQTGTRSERYGDFGQWAVLAYQVTGDPAYAAKAWAKIEPVITRDPTSANQVRQTFLQYALFYDWLKPALTTAQRDAYVAGLNRWAEWSLAIDTPQYVGGFRLADSDQTVGQYFGLAFVDLATGPEGPKAGTWLGETSRSSKVHVGGLDATAADFSTARNAIARYVELAAGGQWVEGSAYNLGTLQLLFTGVLGLRSATGEDHFPEVTAFIREAALAQLYELTPNLDDSYQWGDEEHPRDLRLIKRAGLLAMLAGLTQDDPTVGPYMNQLVDEVLARHGARGYRSAEPIDTFLFYAYNPYAPRADWRGALPPGYAAPGRGLVYYRSGAGTDGSLFGADMSSRVYVDHEVEYFGDFQLYRKGEWGVTHPLGYGGPARTGAGANSMLIAGLSSMEEVRQTVARELADDGSYAYVAGTTRGQRYDQPYYNPPPTFLHEWTRSLLYLPSADGTSDTVVVYDRVNADDPEALPKFARYRSSDRQAIQAAPALKQWVIHAPVAPAVTAGGLSWQTAGGQQVRVSTLSADPRTVTVYDEKQLWPNESHIFDSEKKYQVRLAPTTDQKWDTFLNVVQVSDAGVALRNTRVSSAGGEAEGALIERASQPDTLVLFGARAEDRVHTAGYTVNWRGGAAGTDLYLFDLDPNKPWSVRIDGGAAQSLTVSDQGMARLSAGGTGRHTLELVAR